MKKIFLSILLLLLVAGGMFSFYKERFFSQKKIHYHAGFQVYIDEKLQDFSDFKYMDLKPCTGHEVNEDDQEEKAHLHENIGDVVHVHRANAKWKNLFINIRFPLDQFKNYEGYVNGKKVSNLLDQPIKSYDRAIFFIGTHGDISQYVKNAVTIDHIKKIEHTSELCGT